MDSVELLGQVCSDGGCAALSAVIADIMWVPYSTQDRSMAFRFTIQARRLNEGVVD